jgi:penicillin amidase
MLLSIAGGLVALALLAAACVMLWLYRAERAALPQLDGELHVAGLTAPVTVRRDGHGVPHIEAGSEDDLFFAQGFVTAEDRLWQMDSYRRYANGELAEVLGSSLVEHDRAQRVLQIQKTAERVWGRLAPDERRRFEDYARGVNAFIAACEQSGRWPAEFRLLHYKPRPWTGADSVSVGLMEVQELDMHAATKLDRLYVREKLNNEELEKDLYPVGSWRDHPPTGTETDWNEPKAAPVAKRPSSDDDDDDEDDSSQARVGGLGVDFSRVSESRPGASTVSGVTDDVWRALGRPECAGCIPGSNEWVIAGAHTASGKPLLSNDMHLPLSEPNIWYMAALKGPGFDAAGVTLPGMPYIVAGHNDHVAWGFTALYADVQDLYFEKLDGKGNYEDNNGEWHPLAVDHETIHVRFGKDVAVDVQTTEHGPLVNSMVHEPRPIALKWNIYDPELNGIPLYAMNKAANWTEFSRALAEWSWPSQSVAYSDDQGHIAYHAIGKVPVRGGGVGLSDLPLPHNTKDERSVWGYSFCAGVCPTYIPFDKLPNAFDPPSAFLATANARVTTDQSLFPLTDEWADPYRNERIYKALSGRNGLKAADMLAVQTDVYSEVDQEIGHRLAYAIDQTAGTDERLRKAADLMRSWDGKVTADSAAASIVDQTRAAFWPLILKPKLGADLKRYHWAEQNFAEEEILMHGKAAWLPAGFKDWNALLTEAVRQGLKNGHAPTDLDNWKYGDWHMVDVEHPLAAFLPLLGRLAGTGMQPQSGDTTTVKQTGRAFGPSQRFTIDWSDIDGATENIVLGESGDPLSPYYRDQWKAWYEGTTFALPFTDAAVKRETTHVIALMP